MRKLSHKFYLYLVLTLIGASILPICLLNLMLEARSSDRIRLITEASAWQQRTHGITYAPTLSDTGLFKILRLHDRLPHIDTVVFGSSTALGIQAGMFPPAMHVFNFSQTGHPLTSVIGEAEWLAAHDNQLRYMVIPLDWSLGFIYQNGIPATDLSIDKDHLESLEKPALSWMELLRNSLSYPQIINLFRVAKSILLSSRPLAEFKEYFLQDSSSEYTCPDGTPAKDFDIFYRGTCTGFRYDGSATFANLDPVSNPASLIATAAASSSQYFINLSRHKGEPNQNLLAHLAALNKSLKKRNGHLLLFLPPLLPGMEHAFMADPLLSPSLTKTKAVLDQWARSENIPIIDAGEAEKYGCTPQEFVDQHHALPSCYKRIFDHFWATYDPSPGRTWPTGGLY